MKMKIAKHVLSGHVTELIDDDSGRPPMIACPYIEGAEVQLSAGLLRPVIKWLERPGNVWRRKPPAQHDGIIFNMDFVGVGFDGVYENTKREVFTTFILSLKQLREFEAKNGEASIEKFCRALHDACRGWEYLLPTPPTHIMLTAKNPD